MRAPLHTPFMRVIIYVFAGDYNMPVFCVHVSYFVSFDYLIYSIWKRKRKELITSSRDVSQCWCSGPLMNSCSVRLSTKVFHRIFDRMLEETLTHLVAIRHKQYTFTFLQMTGAFIQSKLQCITLVIYSGNVSAKL